jgi:hypothetical protein
MGRKQHKIGLFGTILSPSYLILVGDYIFLGFEYIKCLFERYFKVVWAVDRKWPRSTVFWPTENFGRPFFADRKIRSTVFDRPEFSVDRFWPTGIFSRPFLTDRNFRSIVFLPTDLFGRPSANYGRPFFSIFDAFLPDSDWK